MTWMEARWWIEGRMQAGTVDVYALLGVLREVEWWWQWLAKLEAEREVV
jgi:hypothetical protein